MAGFGANPTTGTQGSLPSNQFPLSSVAVPGTANGDLTALEGGPASVDSNSNKTAPVSMYVKDGNDLAQGATTDTVWSGSGAGSEIAILKKLVGLLSVALTVSGNVTANAGTSLNTSALALETGGNLASLVTSMTELLGDTDNLANILTQVTNHTVTSNAGTNLNTSLLALETGGNLASAKTDLDAINTAVGTQADVVWSGSGSGSEIAILKKIVAELAATLTVSGTMTATQSTGSNLHTVLDTGSTTAATQSGTWIVQPGNTANTTAWKVDNSAVTQPVSAAALPLPSGAATTAKQPALGTAGAASTDVISVQGITSMTPLKVDGSGVTQPVSGSFWQATQPVNGTVTANQGATWTVQPGNTANTTPWLATLNQGGNSATVTAANALKVDGSAVTQPVSGTVTANAGTNMSTALLALETGGNLATVVTNTTGIATQATLALAKTDLDTIVTNTNKIPSSPAQEAGNLATITTNTANIPAKGAAVTSASMPVNIASDQIVATKQPTSATGTLTSVAGTTTASTQLLVSNTSRKGMFVYNDSTAILYLGFNATVTTTSYTLQIPSNGFFEMPIAPVYTGVIAGVWSATTGNARITELL